MCSNLKKPSEATAGAIAKLFHFPTSAKRSPSFDPSVERKPKKKQKRVKPTAVKLVAVNDPPEEKPSRRTKYRQWKWTDQCHRRKWKM